VIERWYIHLPKQAVAVGSSWKKEGEKETQSSGTQTVTNTTYTFKAMKKEKGRDVAVIDQTQDSKISGAATTPVGVFDVDGSGKGKFEFFFDPTRSRVVKAGSTSDGYDAQAGGDPMHMIVTNHFERELLE
jgi:hypothetical protein